MLQILVGNTPQLKCYELLKLYQMTQDTKHSVFNGLPLINCIRLLQAQTNEIECLLIMEIIKMPANKDLVNSTLSTKNNWSNKRSVVSIL